MKRWLCLALCMVSLLWGCQNAPATTDQTSTENTLQTTTLDTRPVVGICLPREDGMWADRVAFWKRAFEPYGYQVLLRYANGDISQQVKQVQKLASTAELLIVAPLDSAAFSSVLQEVSIPVIAYDSMLTDTDKVSFLATFDYENMGRDMAGQVYSHMESAMTVELLMTQAETEHSLRYYKGLMDVLSGYLEEELLEVPSGRVNFEDTAVSGGLPELASQTLQRYLERYYALPVAEDDPTATTQTPDILIAGSDRIAQACADVLDGNTILCGLGGDQSQGLNYSIEKDYAGLDQACLKAALALLEGKQPESNLEGGMFNNVKDLPCWLGTYKMLYLAEQPAD